MTSATICRPALSILLWTITTMNKCHGWQGLLQAFVEHVKERKTVVLEELAAHFGLRVQVQQFSVADVCGLHFLKRLQ